MHLHPDAVQLAVDEQVTTADGIDRLSGGLRRGGEHRPHRPPDDEPDLFERLDPTHGGEAGHLRRGAREHGGATHDGVGHGIRLRDGAEHHAVEGALPQVAGDQVDEEALLVSGRAAHQPGQLGPAGCRGAGSRGGRQPGERGVDLDHGEGGLDGRVGQRAQRAVADAQPALGQHPGQVRDDQPDLGRVAAREQVGQGLGLGGA